jgi:hypothetical protein
MIEAYNSKGITPNKQCDKRIYAYEVVAPKLLICLPIKL